MSELSTALQRLLEFLGERGVSPPTREILVVEARADARRDARGRLVVQREELRDPAEYEARFESLMHAGYAWLNVSCLGMDDDKLVVAIELPRESAGAASRTSINYSGPSRVVLEHRWGAERVLAIT